MKKVAFIVMLLLLILLSVCFIHYGSSGKKSELETEILGIKEIIIQHQVNIDKLNDKMRVNQSNYVKSNNELTTKYESLDFLVTRIPSLTKSEGYIKSIKKGKDQVILEVQFAERRINNESPKGYIIKKKEIKTFPLNEDASYYLIDENNIMHVNSEDDFLIKAIEYDRYYSFYLENEEVILVQQLLLP